jgi:hypothetical protein
MRKWILLGGWGVVVGALLWGMGCVGQATAQDGQESLWRCQVGQGSTWRYFNAKAILPPDGTGRDGARAWQMILEDDRMVVATGDVWCER